MCGKMIMFERTFGAQVRLHRPLYGTVILYTHILQPSHTEQPWGGKSILKNLDKKHLGSVCEDRKESGDPDQGKKTSF